LCIQSSQNVWKEATKFAGVVFCARDVFAAACFAGAALVVAGACLAIGDSAARIRIDSKAIRATQEENEKQETENRRWKTGQLISFLFPVSCFRFSISFPFGSRLSA
jgi:hypothetical protein